MKKGTSQKIQKITVGRTDEVALIVEKIIDSEAGEVIMNIPRFSRLADSLANFHLIAREAKLLRKKIIIESVDDKIIELAGLAGLESLNPFLTRSRKQFYDIVSATQDKEEKEDAGLSKKQLVETVSHKRHQQTFKPKFGKKIAWTITTLGVVALVLVFGQVLARAEIKIITAKSSWTYNDAVRAEKSVSLNAEDALIPAQVFIQRDTLHLTYPANGKKNVQRKSSGKIVVYNAYDSKPQTLVATTRFVTPDGKMFRLVKTISVPGASVSGGKIIPSSIETDVVADKAGVEYNIGPVSYFSIPGFKESGSLDKFQGFYGESKNSMTGGFIGEVAFPTDDDIKSAKAEMSQTVSKTLREKVLGQIPKNFNIIEGAAGFSILDQKVDNVVDEGGNFAIDVEAQITIIAFSENDLLALMENNIEKEMDGDYVINDFEVKYGQARTDFANGRLSFPVEFTATISKFVDTNLVKNRIKGKSESELRAAVGQLIDLQSAEISLWPFWVKRVPDEEQKISVTIE